MIVCPHGEVKRKMILMIVVTGRVTCNNQTGHVNELVPDDCALRGEISPSLFNLTHLRYLDISSNSFHGTIPKFIGSLVELQTLDLSSNHHLSGTIPSEFGNLANLLDLSLNQLGNCSVENISWLSHLSHLEHLDMSGISLAKADHWVNVILSLQNLTSLWLEGCELSQVMHPYSSPSSYDHVNSSESFSSNIHTISLGDNNLNSSIYSWFYLLTSNMLRSVHLEGNKLDKLPKYFGNLCNLTYLYFNNNSATVPLSDFLKTLSAGCTSHTLIDVDASSNQFTGSISDDIQHFPSLVDLILDDNQLNGTVSEKFWELPNLEAIHISSNSLRNAIFIKTAKLKHKYIDLSKNNFYGGISFLCQIVDGFLSYLDLSHNSFSGQIPDCLWHLKELKVLNLAHNNLSGRLPASVEYLFQLEVLYLYNNSFSGELPLSLRNCTMLSFLDLGSNRFFGNVPVWVGENLSRLYVLNLGSNKFFGSIPLQICRLENLQVLDLSMNNLNDTIPSCFNNLTSMVQERLLAAQIEHLYDLQVKGFSYYPADYIDSTIVRWQGIRRKFTTNLGLLRTIDLSSNNLTGKIPNELTDLHGLLQLNLFKNALFGEIPYKIGQVKQLLTLDLSRNHFSGRIPPSISEITSLSWLDLSYNNLSGRIPSSTQLQSFTASAYTGNAGLCGLPLSKYCPGDLPVPVSSPVREADTDELERWFYISGAIGFGIGFWIVCGILLVNRHGRHAFFHIMDTMEDWVSVKVKEFKVKFQRIAQ
uniref:receptor-like protein EIX2 n=1 Tax=Erigeron canadensis TaxID=72917 RepID=UPI001CB94142|nr:receptor-like protein EIX2 [Erigeron canadensis]